MIIKTSIAALGLLASLAAGLAVSADSPKEPTPRTRFEGSAGEPATGTAETPDPAGASASAHVELDASL